MKPDYMVIHQGHSFNYSIIILESCGSRALNICTILRGFPFLACETSVFALMSFTETRRQGKQGSRKYLTSLGVNGFYQIGCRRRKSKLSLL